MHFIYYLFPLIFNHFPPCLTPQIFRSYIQLGVLVFSTKWYFLPGCMAILCKYLKLSMYCYFFLSMIQFSSNMSCKYTFNFSLEKKLIVHSCQSLHLLLCFFYVSSLQIRWNAVSASLFSSMVSCNSCLPLLLVSYLISPAANIIMYKMLMSSNNNFLYFINCL